MGAPVSSMTGVGLAAGNSEVGELRLEIRAVNGRNLQLRWRLPQALQRYEAAIESAVRSRLQRGSISINVELASAATLLPPRDSLAASARELCLLAQQLGLAPPSLVEVLGLLGSAARNEVATSQPLPPGLEALLQQALDELQTHRIADGSATVAAIEANLHELRRHAEIVRQRAPELVAVYRERLLQRVQEFVAAHLPEPVPAPDLIREVAIYAERVDTAEEQQRLQAHLQEFAATLARGGEVGRRLEFLLQEMLRETNTLGAKSPDAAIAHTVVAMKTCLDRIKEQLANLE